MASWSDGIKGLKIGIAPAKARRIVARAILEAKG
jgi:hypothetical protein